MSLPTGAVVREGVAYTAEGAMIVSSAGTAAITGGTLDGMQRIGFAQTAGGTSDATLVWDAANILGQRNTTTAQRSRVYNTYTDGSNGEWLELGFSANACLVRATANGTGTVRSIFMDGATVNMQIAGTTKWLVNASGHLVSQQDGTMDIGATGSNRPRNLFISGSVQLAQGVAVPAGGSSSAYIGITSTAALGVYAGSGAPTVSAAQGSIYLRTDGSSTSTRLYVNTNGATTWTNVTTAA